jgi:hypothetical protein
MDGKMHQAGPLKEKNNQSQGRSGGRAKEKRRVGSGTGSGGGINRPTKSSFATK